MAACSDDNGTPIDAAAGGDGGSAALTLSTQGSLGARLVDKDGKTLYFFANDVAGSNASACAAPCAMWPTFDVQSPTVGDGLTAMDFGRFDKGGGAFQATWKGRPLYYFSGDTAAGTTAGEASGGRWFVARAYNLFFAANAAVTPSGATAANTPFLTNGAGRSVYVFETDTRGTGSAAPTTSCTSTTCTGAWPLWEKPAALTTPVVPSTIPATDVTFFNNGGKQQFVYKGWPLYFHTPDPDPGDVSGASVPLWHAVNNAWGGTF